MMASRSPNSEYVNSFDPSVVEAWEKVGRELKFLCGEATYNSWIKPLNISSVDDGQIVLSAPTRFIKEWILSHYINEIKDVWNKIDNSIIHVDIVVSKERERLSSGRGITEHHAAAVISESDNFVGGVSSPVKNTQSFAAKPLGTASKSPASSGEDKGVFLLDEINSNLNSLNNFENFVVGPSNELAYAAALSVAESNDVLAGGNPLFLYGGVGLGKTHLMHSIANYIKIHNPDRKVLYLSAEKFMYQFIRSLRNKDVVSFKESFRSVDVLMIDDIQFICGKNSTQEEFFHTFNSLIDDNKQLILTGDRSPSALDGMEERVKSRLGWGLVVDINDTTYELRFGILQSKLEQLREGGFKTEVPSEVIEFIARKISTNVRELEGALKKVVAQAKFIHQDITLETTQRILKDLLSSVEKIITIDDIKQAVSERCNVKISDMHSSRKSRNIARPRQIAMYLSKKMTSHSLPEIGENFGGKDHTTVIHAVKRVESLYAEDKNFRDDVDVIKNVLEN